MIFRDTIEQSLDCGCKVWLPAGGGHAYLERCSTCEAASELFDMCESLYCIVLDGMTADYDYMTEQLGDARILIAKARGRVERSDST